MIRLLLRLPLYLVAALAISWAGSLIAAGTGEALLQEGEKDLPRAYAHSGVRAQLLRRASEGSRAISRALGFPDGGLGSLGRAALEATLLHAEGSRRALRFAALLLGACLSAGLAFRERLRGGESYASPTAAGLGRLGVGAGLLGAGIFALSPVPFPFILLYLAILLVAFGSAVYIANLPLQI